MPTRLVLVRHGHSRAVADGVVGGHRGCAGLTDEGRRQVEALRDRLLQSGLLRPATSLVASVLPRAVETAEILSPAIGYGSLAVNQRCELCELHAGDADGMAWKDYADQFGDPRWEIDPDVPMAPGGESWTGFVARAAAGLRALVDGIDGHTAVVASHGGVIEASFTAFLGPGAAGDPFSLRPDNAGLTIWSRPDGEDRWRLDRYNDIAHLD